MSEKLKQRRILLVDDNANTLELLSDFLRGIGYAVRETRDAEEAMKVAKEDPVDLAIIDLKIPGMDGINLMLSLRKIKPHLPVIIYSGYPFIDTATEALKMGADDYVNKPFLLNKLKMSIDQVFDKHKSSILQTSSE